MHFARIWSFLLLTSGALLAQNFEPAPPKEEDPAKIAPTDPFTGNVAKAMQAVGVVAYGPFVLCEGLRTEDVDKVLGEKRIRWLETTHFRIGCTLGTTPAPEDSTARKLMNGELARLRKRHGKFPDRASKIDPWLRLHLYASRCEELYTEFVQLVGHADTTGTHLGSKDKFVVLLFQKKSDLARYLDRFCGSKSEVSQRCRHGKAGTLGFVLTAEGEDARDEASVHAHFRFLLMETFCDALGDVPYWASLGLAHVYERQVPCNTMLAAIKDDESVEQESQNKWPTKMKRRAQHDTLLLPFAQLASTTDFGYWAHLQAWSRVDYLLTTDRAKFGEFLAGMKGGGSAKQMQALELVYGTTPEAFDAAWRDWVLKTYR